MDELAILLGAGVVALYFWNGARAVADLTDRLDAALPDRLAQWAPQIAAAAAATVPAELDLWTWAKRIAAVMDRESAGGMALSPRGAAGTGDNGHGLGLMQLDDGPAGAGAALRARGGDPFDASQNIAAGAAWLADFYRQAIRRGFSTDDALTYATAAYNAGPKVFALSNPDSRTTGGDYSSDVERRAAQWS